MARPAPKATIKPALKTKPKSTAPAALTAQAAPLARMIKQPPPKTTRIPSVTKPLIQSPPAAPIAKPAQHVPPATAKHLANESGQDALKHGSEARFMQGLATEEFAEENYVGDYVLHTGEKVWIEDDRAQSGHLILHAQSLGLHRPLFRFNRYIYVYGQNPDSPSPILGSVMFLSDGDRIHQFILEYNGTSAYFPRRPKK